MANGIKTAVMALTLATGLAGPAFAADPPLKVSSGEAAKGQQSVVIGAFNVGFIFESVDNGEATGGLIGAFGGATKAKSELVGVTPAIMQSVTDAAYDDFKAQLTAQGYTVADSAAMFTSPELGKAKPTPAPYEASILLEKKSNGKGYYYKPTALQNQYFLPGDLTIGTGGMFGGFSAMGPAMQAGGVAAAVATYAKASGQAVIDVTYLIDFSQVKRPGAFSFGGIKVNSGMAVVDEFSRLSLVNPAGKTATILIKQPVAVEGEFATMEDTTKGGTMQSAANVMGGLMAARFGLGGMKFGKTKSFKFTVNPDTYPAGATKAATLANTRVVTQLVALR